MMASSIPFRKISPLNFTPRRFGLLPAFNSSEKRLARILLLMAEFGKPGEQETLIPEITQETLAEMIGTTRSRVSFFMNRFRDHGFIEYNGRIRVHKSLLNVILHDRAFEQNSVSAPLVETGPVQSETALKRAAGSFLLFSAEWLHERAGQQ